jgi:hypothetical protein
MWNLAIELCTQTSLYRVLWLHSLLPLLLLTSTTISFT